MSNISSSDKLVGVKHNNVVSVWFTGAATLSKDISPWSELQIATIPSGFRPKSELFVPAVGDYGVGMAKFKTDGSVYVIARGNKLNGNIVVAATYKAS